jgi:uncharacterized protein (TIGR02300 family)
MTLVKADLGTKRICPNCSSRFYDLQKRPIECPKCAFSFEPESLYKQRRPRQPEAEKPVVVERARDEEVAETEEVEAEEAEEAEEAGVEVEAATLEPVEDEEEEGVVAGDEETESAGMSVVDPAAEEPEIEDIDEEEIAEEDAEDPTLLEDVGEEEDDVSGIIDTDIGKDER